MLGGSLLTEGVLTAALLLAEALSPVLVNVDETNYSDISILTFQIILEDYNFRTWKETRTKSDTGCIFDNPHFNGN